MARATVEDLGQQGSLRLRGAWVVGCKVGSERSFVQQVLPGGTSGVLGESFWNMLLTVAYLLPAAGTAAGSLPSACHWSLEGLGISDDFLHLTGRHIATGRAGLLLMTGHANVDPILSMLNHVAFSVTSTNLTNRQLSALETFFGPARAPVVAGRDSGVTAVLT